MKQLLYHMWEDYWPLAFNPDETSGTSRPRPSIPAAGKPPAVARGGPRYGTLAKSNESFAEHFAAAEAAEEATRRRGTPFAAAATVRRHSSVVQMRQDAHNITQTLSGPSWH